MLTAAEIPVPSNPVSGNDFSSRSLSDWNAFLQPPNDRDALAMHAEVLAMQAQWGFTYQEAAHRLYLSEVRKLEALTDAKHAFCGVRERVDKAIDLEICPALAKSRSGWFVGE